MYKKNKGEKICAVIIYTIDSTDALAIDAVILADVDVQTHLPYVADVPNEHL